MLKITLPQIAQWTKAISGMKGVGLGMGWSRSAKNILEKVFSRLEQQGKIGRLVLDAGSSWSSLAVEFGYSSNRFVVIGVDVGFEKEVQEASKLERFDPDLLRVKGDLHNLAPALGRPEVLAWLQTREIAQPKFNTILLSDILNYVDYRQVIHALKDTLLLPGGRIITCNMAGVVYKPELDHPQGVKKNSELLDFMRATGLAEEEVHPASKGVEFTRNQSDLNRQVLVFRK